ncbi:hypothetical protein IAU60_000740 [Kwoniella sp. DSM 27419]
MVFQNSISYLASKLDICFDEGGVVHMTGPIITGTKSHYSLPGHVLISLPSLPQSSKQQVREVRNLELLVEGKSEFWDETGRHTPLRLWATTVVLATPAAPLPIPSHDAANPSAQRMCVAVPVDLSVPAWLPPSHEYRHSTVSYGLIGKCKIGWASSPASGNTIEGSAIDNQASSSSSDVSLLGNPFKRAKRTITSFDSFFSGQLNSAQIFSKSSSDWSPFTLSRHYIPVSIFEPANPRIHKDKTVYPSVASRGPCALECMVTVPDWVDLSAPEETLVITVKVKAVYLSSTLACPRLVSSSPDLGRQANRAASDALSGIRDPDAPARQPVQTLGSLPMVRQAPASRPDLPYRMVELSVWVEQIDRVSSTVFEPYITGHLIPLEQPAHGSFEHQLISPRSIYADGGIMGHNPSPTKSTKSRKYLVLPDARERSFTFANEGLSLSQRMWRSLVTRLPMPLLQGSGQNARPDPDMNSPFLKIRHHLKLRMVYRMPDSDTLHEVTFTAAIRFGTCHSTLPTDIPRGPLLPAYVQLYHENGQPRSCDPLPLYENHGVSADESASEVQQESEQMTADLLQPAEHQLGAVPAYDPLVPSAAISTCSSRSASPTDPPFIPSLDLPSRFATGTEGLTAWPLNTDEPMEVDNAGSSDHESRQSASGLMPSAAKRVRHALPSVIQTVGV